MTNAYPVSTRSTIDNALAAVYVAIERETENCNDGSILTGLADLVVALNDIPIQS